MAAALIGISMPNFVLGPLLVLWLSLTLYLFPPALWEGFGAHLVLPVLTLSAIYMAYIARLTRAGMLEVLRSITGEGRLIEPEEIARVIAFAADQPVLNGTVIHANLGQKEN